MKLLTPLLLLFTFVSSAQDTSYVTYEIQHDSLIRTTIPDVIYIGGYDTTVNEGSSFNAYYINQLYAEVIGDVTVITPDYDTIPAHDTVFVCTLCAVHDTTIIVIIPAPETAINGMFPNPGTFTPLAARIHTAIEYSCNAFRPNLDVGSPWNVKQVHDSGLVAVMTYNDPPCCNLQYFLTGADIAAGQTRLRNYMNANINDLPEVISWNNEEPNFNYWKGAAQDYVNWMNAATEVANEFGVPSSNGGILPDFVYYMRWVYQTEGKTDSVNLLNSRGHLFAGTGAAAQAAIDWYKIEIPGIAASNMTYVNFHWYEPRFNLPTNSDTTTGILPLVIQFLRSRTGKEVITTEFGSKYDSQNLFNQEADEIHDSGVRIRVYYYGTNPGPVSDPHPDWWEAWILR